MTDTTLRRRALLAGAGGAALGTGLLGNTASAHATDHAPGPAAGRSVLAATSIPTIASPLQNGYTYRSVHFFDFEPEDPSSRRTWGGQGVYTASVGSTLWAGVTIPTGALVRDVEWYVYNASGVPVHVFGRLGPPDVTGLNNPGVDGDLASTGTQAAARLVVPADAAGPYLPGTRFWLGFLGGSSSLTQVTGARVGFTGGGSELGFLSPPRRVYDSRSVGRFAAGETRAITVPTSIAPTGAVGIAATITSTGPTASGWLKAWPAYLPEPGTSVLNFAPNQTATSGITVGLSTSGQLKIKANVATHVILDVTGIYG